MKLNQKLNQILGKKDLKAAQFAALISDYCATFKDRAKRQIFQGIRMQYTAQNGYSDDITRRGFRPLQNTVPAYLKYFLDTCGDHVTNTFDIEATNASGNAVAELIVAGVSWGKITSSELLRLKDFLDNASMADMYANLPVRDGDLKWVESTDQEIKEEFRASAWQTEEQKVQYPTTEKKPYILVDPNVTHLKEGAHYVAPMVSQDTRVNTGDQIVQRFSGEISHTERAEILKWITDLKAAVREALAEANTVPIVKSKLTAELIFTFIHTGKHLNSLTKP